MKLGVDIFFRCSTVPLFLKYRSIPSLQSHAISYPCDYQLNVIAEVTR